jgi:hypothetical protein
MTLPKKIEEQLSDFDRIDAENVEYKALDMLEEQRYYKEDEHAQVQEHDQGVACPRERRIHPL